MIRTKSPSVRRPGRQRGGVTFNARMDFRRARQIMRSRENGVDAAKQVPLSLQQWAREDIVSGFEWYRPETQLTQDTPSHFDAFLSSRIAPLESLRRRLHDSLKAQEIFVWVSEIYRPDLKYRPLGEIVTACLDQIHEATLFVCLVEGSYGTTESDELGELSLLELEIALAALTGERIYAFELQADSEDPRMLGLVKSIEMVEGSEIRAVRKDELVDVLSRLLHQATQPQPLRRSVLHALGVRLDPRRSATEVALDDQWQAHPPFPMVRPLAGRVPDIARITELLARVDASPDIRERLLLLWAALRHLVAIPWRSSSDVDVLLSWRRLRVAWDKATGWLGQHSDSFLSRLAAQREQRELAERLFQLGQGRSTPDQDPSGASASLLYSLAQRQTSNWARRRLLRRALRSINGALAERDSAASLRHTRAATYLQLLHFRLGLHDAETALRLREQVDDTVARIGEAEGTFSWALAANLRLGRALEYARTGLVKLRASKPTGFTIRGMKRLTVLQAANLQFEDALATLSEATALADTLKIIDQASQLRTWTRRIRKAARLIPFDRSRDEQP